MLAWMARARFLLALLWLGAVGCGGAMADDLGEAAGGGHSSGGRDGGSPQPWDGGDDVRSEYVEPTCPDAGPALIANECDPFAPRATCPSGLVCYPFVDYPDAGDPCAREQYGAECVLEGHGTQGEGCSTGPCSAGFACVVTGQGTQCARLCHTARPDDCPRGLLCIPMDIEPGVGACI